VLKVALIVQRFPGGGAEGYVMELAKRLNESGNQVIVVTSGDAMLADSYPFPVMRLKSLFSIGEYSLWSGLTHVLKNLNGYIVHINTYGYFHADLASFCRKFFSYKTVLTSHGFAGMELRHFGQTGDLPFYSPLKIARTLRPVYDKVLGRMEIRNADALIALSQRDVELYNKLGADTDKIRIIPPGVNDIFFNTPAPEQIRRLKEQIGGEPLLVSVGDLSLVKARDLALKALPLILREEPKAKLVFIGKDMGLKKSLIDLSNRLDANDSVLFLDHMQPQDLLTFLHISDILLHTSLAEGLSTVLLEAMACKLPFVTTPAGGNGYLANETGAGLVVAFNDEKALATAVMNLWQDRSLLMNMKDNASISAPRFSWNRVFHEILALYRDVKGVSEPS